MWHTFTRSSAQGRIKITAEPIVYIVSLVWYPYINEEGKGDWRGALWELVRILGKQIFMW